MRTKDSDGNHTIEVRASTGAAFKAACQALDTVLKLYPGLALWEVSREDISSNGIAAIVEPAQVLVMTAELVSRNTAGRTQKIQHSPCRSQ